MAVKPGLAQLTWDYGEISNCSTFNKPSNTLGNTPLAPLDCALAI